MRLVPIIVAVIVAGCGAGAGPGGTPTSLRGLPPPSDPPYDLDDDDDLGRARDLYEAMRLDDPARATRRRELVAAYQRRIKRDGGDAAQVFENFQDEIGLWDARELQKEPVPDLELVVGDAQEVYRG